MLYALEFLGAMRFGEAAARTWRDYDATSSTLCKLVIERSYSSKARPATNAVAAVDQFHAATADQQPATAGDQW